MNNLGSYSHPLGFFYNGAKTPQWAQCLLIVEALRSHSDTPRSVGLLWTSNPTQRPLSDNTPHSQQTDIRAPDGIRTHNLSRRAAEDLHLRPRGHSDRLTCRLAYGI